MSRRLQCRPLLVAVAATVALGLEATAAQASFTGTASMSATIGTVTVAAPTDLTVQTSGCNGRWVDVTLSWRPSTSSKVVGYQVTAYRSDGIVQTVAQTDAATTQLQQTADRNDLFGYTTTLTVTTMTSYGWTRQSAQSGAITC